MPLQADDAMTIYCFDGFNGLVAWVNSCHSKVRRQVLDALAMNRIDLASLSKETLHHTALSAFILQAGIFGPPLFIFLQILQTVVPIIPGALTSVAGVFIYGHIIGTIYNYIGIVIGCAIIFHLARMYGPKFVQSMVSQKTYDKYINWLNEDKRFDRFFIFMMIWPISPADFLCMLAGLTNMTFKRYMTIIILCKPITLVIYTYGLTYIIDYFWQMI